MIALASPTIRNERGSAMIELTVAGSIIALVLGLGFYLLYLSYAKAWMTRSVREAAVCLVTPETSRRCREKLEMTLKAGLPFGHFDVTEFRVADSASNVEVSLDIEPRFVETLETNKDRPPTRMRVSNSAPL